MVNAYVTAGMKWQKMIANGEFLRLMAVFMLKLLIQ